MIKSCLFLVSIALYLYSCNDKNTPLPVDSKNLEVVVLGIAQDAGYPQINCKKLCCQAYYNKTRKKQRVTCLGVVDRKAKKSFLIEATPDISSQLKTLKDACSDCEFSGIIITHAHIGHYTGLMQLGREAMGAKNMPVYVMPKMADFLQNNGPWSQLVSLKNIKLFELNNLKNTLITNNLKITPLTVPHRDEFSETVGFKIWGDNKSLLFIPDIDKWEKWENNIETEIENNDYALLDGTFYDDNELPGRNMSEIPHPFISESMLRFNKLDSKNKRKINFIHFNHTNPIMNVNSKKRIFVLNKGFSICHEGKTFDLE